jgi:hypothetical protein
MFRMFGKRFTWIAEISRNGDSCVSENSLLQNLFTDIRPKWVVQSCPGSGALTKRAQFQMSICKIFQRSRWHSAKMVEMCFAWSLLFALFGCLLFAFSVAFCLLCNCPLPSLSPLYQCDRCDHCYNCHQSPLSQLSPLSPLPPLPSIMPQSPLSPLPSPWPCHHCITVITATTVCHHCPHLQSPLSHSHHFHTATTFTPPVTTVTTATAVTTTTVACSWCNQLRNVEGCHIISTNYISGSNIRADRH